jgi:hypothetical protein
VDGARDRRGIFGEGRLTFQLDGVATVRQAAASQPL